MSRKKTSFVSILKRLAYKTADELLYEALKHRDGLGFSLAFMVDEFGWDTVERLYEISGKDEKIKLESRKEIADKMVNSAKYILYALGDKDLKPDKILNLNEIALFFTMFMERPDFFRKICDEEQNKILDKLWQEIEQKKLR